MTTFPGSPRLIKGAIIGIDPINPVPNVIIFQYNPDTLTRTLKAKTSGEGGNPSEVLRLKGAPVETIKLDLEIDATDQLEKADSVVVTSGIYPQLSALEMLIYPKSATVIINTVLLAAGTIEISTAIRTFHAVHLGPAAGVAGDADRLFHYRRGL